MPAASATWAGGTGTFGQAARPARWSGDSERTSSIATAELPPANDAMRRTTQSVAGTAACTAAASVSTSSPSSTMSSSPIATSGLEAPWPLAAVNAATGLRVHPPEGEGERRSRLAGSISSLSSAVIEQRPILAQAGQQPPQARAGGALVDVVLAQLDRRLEALPLARRQLRDVVGDRVQQRQQ